MSVNWNPWHGCRKISEGCRHCYVYRQDARHDKDSREVRRTMSFDLPVRRGRDGQFKIPSGQTVYTCFTSDFLVEEADAWRPEAWEMMRERQDLRFFFITKRIDRLMQVLPPDWGDGLENLAVGCTVENQATADYRLPQLLEAPLRHKLVICAPLLGPINIAPYLGPDIEEVSVGGESGNDARVCDFDWVLGIRSQCIGAGIPFRFHQTGARLDASTASAASTSMHRPAKQASTTCCTAESFLSRAVSFPGRFSVIVPLLTEKGVSYHPCDAGCRADVRTQKTSGPYGAGCTRILWQTGWTGYSLAASGAACWYTRAESSLSSM